MFYKNNSVVTKTFYGVTFKPGEIKEVPGYINYKHFEIVAAPKQLPKEPPKVKQPTKSIELIKVPKTSVQKVEHIVEQKPVEVSVDNQKTEQVQEQPKKKRRRSSPTAIISTKVESTVEITKEQTSEEQKPVENTITKEENA